MSNRKLTIFLLALLLLTGGSAARAYTNVDVGISFGFHDVLAPYGTWVQVGSYGQCWRPRVSAGFVPFTSGHWAYTSYGPTWIGTEPWAWCAYHYGHWVYSPVYGWVWMPGYTWSPGPVTWAYGADYLAWSPYMGAGPNFNFWIGIDRTRFGYSNYSGYILPRTTVRSLMDRRVVRVHSGTLQRAELERIVGRPVRVERVEERRVVADRHATRLILPQGHSATALREISRVQRQGTRSVRATGTQVRNRSEKHVNFTSHARSASNRPSMTERGRVTQHTVTRKPYTSSHSMNRATHSFGSRYTKPARSYTSRHTSGRTYSTHSMAPRHTTSRTYSTHYMAPRHTTNRTYSSRYVAPRHNVNSHGVTSASRTVHSFRPQGSSHSSHAMTGNTARAHQSHRSPKSSKAHRNKPQ